jgi:hypothetical protein
MTASEVLVLDMHRDTNCELAMTDCRALIAGYGEEVCIAALRELRRQPYGSVRNRAGWLRSKIEFSNKPFEDAVRRMDRGGLLREGLPY